MTPTDSSRQRDHGIVRVRRMLAAAAARDEGIGLIEVAIAMGIMFVAVLGLMSTVLVGYADIGLARQRQAATALANRAMEQVRGLKPADVARGLYSGSSQFQADANIVNCSGTYYFKFCPPTAGAEQIVSNSSVVPGSPAPPIYPHTSTDGPPSYPSSFTRALYITEAINVPQAGALRVTVVVSWVAKTRGNRPASMQTQSLLYAPVGCVDPATHPFAAPCDPFLYGAGSLTPGAISISGTVDSQVVTASLGLTASRADAQSEQLARLQSSAIASGLTLDSTGGSQAAGTETATATADDDPATAPEPDAYDSSVLSAGGATTYSTSTPVGTVLQVSSTYVTPAADSGQAVTAIAAGSPYSGGGTQTCPVGGQVSAQTDGLPCSYSQVQQTGTLNAGLNLRVNAVSLGLTTLANVLAQSAPSYLMANRDAQTGAAGRMTETGTRRIGQIDLLTLPVGAVLPGWQGYFVRVGQYSDAVTAVAGTGTNAPTVTRTGSVTYWTGAGYATTAIANGSPVTLSLGTASATVVAGAQVVDVTMSGTLRTGGTSIVDSAGGAPNATRTLAEARSNSPIIADLHYTMAFAGNTVVDLAITVDLGSLVARSSYQAASVAS